MNNIKEYDFPVLKCNDFGHNCENILIPIGAKVSLNATDCRVEILEIFLK
jgi:muramoyltetrapeptide carboxypeptidase